MPIIIENLDVQVQDAPPAVSPPASDDPADVLAQLAQEEQRAERRERQVVD
ncbi:MAG TPA: hypothetical protein VFS67_36630 [Polyangiaceae bacterium]|jgi:hypothetical protein|nr:hypothetical protein [Polyangiaceae bacterium]